MPTLNETYVNSLKINRLTKTQLNNATELSPNNVYLEDPEFVGGKLLETTSDGNIVESSQTIPTKTSDLTNDSGFISGITSAMVTTALGYSPVNPTALANVATSGSYNDLSNKPTIPAAQVNSDWNANSGVAQILNKPTLATVATTGAYSDLSGTPTIPTVNNPTITITQGGVTKGSFTLNQSTGDTIALDAGGGNPLPSQTGNAGKFLTTDGTDASWGVPSSFKLFHHDWFDYQLNDQSWLRADTFSWQDGTVYSDAYNHLVDDIDGKTATSETVGSYTISYYLADDGHKITTDETTVANIYNESGVAWYYILDTTNQRFKLPRELPITDKSKGNGMTLGVTDGNKLCGAAVSSNYHCMEAYPGNYGKNVGSTNSSTGGLWANSKTVGITTDQTKSGIISHRANENGQQYLYFYVGQFSQTATEQTAGLNSELFNGKVDLNLNNMNPSSTAKETIGGWSTSSKNLGDNGYVKFLNGLIIQWGITSNNAATYQTPFTSGTSYSIVVEQKRSSQYGQTAVLSTSSTGFTAGSNGGVPLFWIAIGY